MLIECYNIARQSEFLQGIHHEFGKISQNPPNTTPAVIWDASSQTEEIIPPQKIEEDVILDGKLYKKTEMKRRKAYVNIFIYERNYERLEALLSRVTAAFFEAIILTTSNGNLTAGKILDREYVSDNTVGYVFTAYLIIPLYRLELLENVDTTKSTITPRIG